MSEIKVKFGFIVEFVHGQPVKFLLQENKNNQTSMVAATITTEKPLSLNHLISDLPDDFNIEINLKELSVFFQETKTKPKETTRLISLNLGSKVSFDKLPLVGKNFTGNQAIEIDSLKILFASAQLQKEDLKSVQLPEIINKGLNLSTSLKIDDQLQQLTISVPQKNTSVKSLPSKSTTKPKENTSQTNDNASSPKSDDKTQIETKDGTKWIDLKKKFGPVYLARIGLKYQNSEIWILLDASLSAAGLTLTLVGLSIGFALKDIADQKLNPKFNLQGLGISFKSSGAIEIGGTFIHSTIKDKDGKERDDYSGALIIKTEAFTITAIGSYTEIEGQPSIFIYGVLDKPIGGPPFFFVTGLALGFAYNRSLLLPNLDKIADFPLVKAAYSNTTPDLAALNQIQNELTPYIPPKIGDIVLAIGIRFTSFKIIDTFALLVANFGNEFSLSLLGISTITSPPNLQGTPTTVSPLVQVRFVILARFVPSEGTLKVDGKILPDSYLFDKRCQLSGGFAFYSWFKGEHEGDFVLTLGGYHPDFNVPAHYPKVDPLQLNWQITNELSIKGSVYFALTSAAIMAGGRLEAVWQSGDLKAWFIANTNFIVAWKPYSYDAQISLRIGASYTFSIKIFKWRIHKTISVEVGADLHIWGPEFAGTATVNLSIISFTIRFGNQSRPQPKPISWDDFKASFLPKNDNEVCSIAFESGLTRKIEDKNEVLWVVNPKEFCLITNSVIPIKTFNVEITDSKIKRINVEEVGIAPMDIKPDKFSLSYYEVKLYQIVINEKKEEEKQDRKQYFRYEAIYKNVPSGLWGQSIQPNLNGKAIPNVLSGFKIKPANPLQAGTTKAIPIKNLLFGFKDEKTYSWEKEFSTISKKQKDIQKTIVNPPQNRNLLLLNLGFSQSEIDQINLQDFSLASFDQAFIKSPEFSIN
jgi:hypothetical protein